VSKQIAQQRREVLAGKKGIELMMEARAISEGALTIDDADIDHQSAFIDATFRLWGWKAQAQFAKWAEAERNIIADMKEEHEADRKNAKLLSDLVNTKKFYNEEAHSYKDVVKGLKREWFLTCDGAVDAMKHKPATDTYSCHVRYVSKRLGNQVTTLTIKVEKEWVIENYGKEVAEYIKAASERKFNGFMPVLVNDKKLSDVDGKDAKVDSIRFVNQT
jgi:hypothetical protein